MVLVVSVSVSLEIVCVKVPKISIKVNDNAVAMIR